MEKCLLCMNPLVGIEGKDRYHGVCAECICYENDDKLYYSFLSIRNKQESFSAWVDSVLWGKKEVYK